VLVPGTQAQKGGMARGRAQVFKAAWHGRNSSIFLLCKKTDALTLRRDATLRVACGYRKLLAQFCDSNSAPSKDARRL